jgi:hypothetical protein
MKVKSDGSEDETHPRKESNKVVVEEEKRVSSVMFVEQTKGGVLAARLR